MKALICNLRLNSLYSIRIPFTWQSALTYPILPPSSVIGLLANALQRYRNDQHPLEYLKLIEENAMWAGSRLLSACIIKSHITSAIVKWKDSLTSKFTNALGRQYAFSHILQIGVVFKNGGFITDLINGLKCTPVTCGDSESLASVEDIRLSNAEKLELNENTEIETLFPIPMSFEKYEIVEGGGLVYMMHKRCKQQNGKLPLYGYLIPLKEARGVFIPVRFKLKLKSKFIGFKIDGIGIVLSAEN